MARKSCVEFLRSCFAVAALPLLCAALASLSACDKGNDQTIVRRYCDQSGCYACTNDNSCYPVPGDPAKPDPAAVTTCDNDAACGAGRLCNLGRCETACSDNSACASGMACISGRCRPSDSAACGVTNARCTADSQCGSTQRCVNRVCATSCPDGKCALGQICQAGACIEDPKPTTAQCTFDTDCGGGKGGFRCINAYCLATCTDNNACAAGATCLKGVCRGSR
jgi:hypothetical protein